VEGTSFVNLVPFGSDITELHMYENHTFVVPYSVCVCPIFFGCMHIVCLDVQGSLQYIYTVCAMSMYEKIVGVQIGDFFWH